RQIILRQELAKFRMDVRAHVLHLLRRRSLSFPGFPSTLKVVHHHLADLNASLYKLFYISWFGCKTGTCEQQSPERYADDAARQSHDHDSLITIWIRRSICGTGCIIASLANKRGGRGAARCPFCSQNAHGETVLVRCAQYKATLAAPLGQVGKFGRPSHGLMARLGVPVGVGGEKVARSSRSISPHP